MRHRVATRLLSTLVLGVALVFALAVAGSGAAQAAAGWQAGPLVETQSVDCLTGDVIYEAGSYLSYYADPENPPQVGQTYYVAIDVAFIGDNCVGAYGDFNLVLPPGTAPAVSAAHPVRCYMQLPGHTTFASDTSSDCPQSVPQVTLPDGQVGYQLDPAGVNPPFWQLGYLWEDNPAGMDIELQVPVTSSLSLNGTTKFQGYVQLADGGANPVLAPTLAAIVNPAGAQGGGAQPNQQIGIFYLTPSISSNVPHAGAGTDVGYTAYVQNNSNPGSVVAQLAYADATGHCSTPGMTVYTTPTPAVLRNPQTQLTGSFTNLYPNVAYCWRLKATVTSGAEKGEYDGNWQYFVTAGSYIHTSDPNEPAPATPQDVLTCSANGSGCAPSSCGTGSSCGSLPTLTETVSGPGSITVTGGLKQGAGTTCSATCSQSYASGTAVTVTETPGAGAAFAGWAGACSGTGTCTLTLSSSQSVSATFSPPTTAGSGGSGGGGSGGGSSGGGPGPGPSPGGTVKSSHTPPSTRIVSHQVTRRTRHHAAAATFKFKATGTATRFQCALVRAAEVRHRHRANARSHTHARAQTHRHVPKPRYAACRSPKSYAHLAQGHYTFYVRAVGAGGADPTPAKLSFVL